MSSETLELLRYGLYGLTVILGILLLMRLIRASAESAAPVNRSRPSNRVIEPAPDLSVGASEVGESDRVLRIPFSVGQPGGLRRPEGPARDRSMAKALSGIRLPLHWEPDAPDQVTNPLRLTSTADTPAEMATTVADELARLGFTVIGTGARSAEATRNGDRLDIEVIPNESSVTTEIALSEVRNG